MNQHKHFEMNFTWIYFIKSMIIFVNTIHLQSKLVRLLETFECHMIAEIRKKIDKEATLATAERVRVESNLATDLWKRPVSSGLVIACSDKCTRSVHLSLS